MAVSHRGGISCGLVYIPIGLYTATQDNDVHFNQLHKDDHQRIRYKKVCGHCGEEVRTEDIVKGFEYEDGKYVVVTDEEFEKIKTEKDRSIQVHLFCDLQAIRPIYYNKTYHVIPEKGGEKAFELLRRAMLKMGKVAIGKTVMGNSETLLTLIPTEDGMLAETMFFADEVKDAPKEVAKPEPSEQELTMAEALIGSMDKAFVPEEFHDDYQQRLRDLIQQKIAGEEIVAAAPEHSGKIIDLMEAMKMTIDQNNPDKKKPAPRKRKPKGA